MPVAAAVAAHACDGKPMTRDAEIMFAGHRVPEFSQFVAAKLN